MLATLESFFHRSRHRMSRSEWAIRHLKLTTSEHTGEEPGLLLIQIDGLSRHQMEEAMKRGEMPFLRKLKEGSGYHMHTFYPGIPSTTPAVQGELYYGVRAIVPAFSFRDHESGEMGSLFDPEWAKKIEEHLSSQGEGLLKGGSSWSNIYRGGAAPEESHFCVASLGMGDVWRMGKIGNFFLFMLLQIPAFIRIFALIVLELVIGLIDAIPALIRGQRLTLELGMVLSRMCVGIGLREVVTIGGRVDVTRGLPIVHLNFLGYDELSHRRGPGSKFAHWSLRGIDSSIESLYRAAHRSRRRDYQVWIFSDHGQERTKTFDTIFTGGVSDIISDCLEVARKKDAAFYRPDYLRWPLSRRMERWRRERKAVAPPSKKEKEPFTVAAMGPVGHVYFSEPFDDVKKHALACRLVKEGKIPGVLHRHDDGHIVWYHKKGEIAVPQEIVGHLHSHPEPLRSEIAQDLVGLCENKDAGDLILLGWDLEGDPWSFAPERGAHAGPGVEETQGFLLVPPATRLPQTAENFVRPSELREAALALLGRKTLVHKSVSATLPSRLRVMSYNVHSCIGMDGRVSPRRIARAIAQQSPDIVALQELDHGRERSRGEDQAAAIAEILGFHVTFCPTVICGEERYGHAVLSRWPLEVVRVAALPGVPKGIWPEPRGALWTRLSLGELRVNILTTHLGLSGRERLLQMDAILGEDWLGPALSEEPVIFCGDFNLTPGSPAHLLAATRLRDVASDAKCGVLTFSSTKLFTQLDHIFISRHFVTEQVFAAKNHVTRLASDHLPLVADLRIET